jgi:ribonuclease-3
VNEAFGHSFGVPALLQQALRHRSAGSAHNERMEFLGDALVNLIIAEALHTRWPKADEGALTRARASLVRESALAEIARRLKLGEFLELGPGEMKSGGQRRDSILADALEALVAAIHLDAGYENCRSKVLPWFEPMLDELPVGKVEKDAKTRLQEWLQARQFSRPEYTLLESSGEEHARIFRVRCQTETPSQFAEAEAGSLRAAEQACAALVLAQIEVTR